MTCETCIQPATHRVVDNVFEGECLDMEVSTVGAVLCTWCAGITEACGYTLEEL